MFNIQFLGAAKTVTGSCYLVTYKDTKFLVDCGMFQGPDVEPRNAEKWPFTGEEIDFVLLTHAHIDHSGLLPKLARIGFNGPIYATNNTISITSLLLLDSAKIQELNAKRGKFDDTISSTPIQYYNTSDAEKAIRQFKSVKFHQKFNPASEIEVEYIPAGHILGAASILVDLGNERVAFSGDVGRDEHQLIESFDPNDKREVDYVVMESLYGGITHPSRESSVFQLINEVAKTTKEGGNVLIPAFAVERTQNLLIDFKRAKAAGTLPESLMVYLDSPLADKVTEIYRGAVASMKTEFFVEKDLDERDLFGFPGLRVSRSSKDSRKLKLARASVLVAGSGMVNGGRILSHVITHMQEPTSHLILVGFQAEATYGRLLSEGVRELIIDDMEITIRGKVTHLEGFSAHGDHRDLLSWVSRYKGDRLKKVFLVHAEPDRSDAFRTNLLEENITNEENIYIPDWKEVIEL